MSAGIPQSTEGILNAAIRDSFLLRCANQTGSVLCMIRTICDLFVNL